MTRILDHAARFWGYLNAIRTDQGPEFTRMALDRFAMPAWRSAQVDPGRQPRQNAFIESFNGRPHAQPVGYLMLLKLSGKETETVTNALIRNAHRLPHELYRSLT